MGRLPPSHIRPYARSSTGVKPHAVELNCHLFSGTGSYCQIIVMAHPLNPVRESQFESLEVTC